MTALTTLSDSAMRHTPPDVGEMVVNTGDGPPDPLGPRVLLYRPDVLSEQRPARRAPCSVLRGPTVPCPVFARTFPVVPTHTGSPSGAELTRGAGACLPRRRTRARAPSARRAGRARPA